MASRHRQLPLGLSSRHGILALAAAIASLLLLAAGASAAVIARPTGDVKNEWLRVGAPTASDALDDDVSTKSLPTGDYITAGPSGEVADVRLAPQTLAKGKQVDRARLWFAGKTAREGRLLVQVKAGGRLLGTRRVPGNRDTKWRSMEFRVPNGGSLAHLRARFTSEASSAGIRGVGTQVQAAFARVKFAPAGDEAGGTDSDSQGGVDSAAGSGGPVQVFGPDETLRPDVRTPAGGTDSARLAAAQNEFESFQVNVQGGPDGLGGVGVSLAGNLAGPNGASIPADKVEIYREAYYTVDADEGKPRSSGLGAEGRWPDALIPERDSFYHEDRSAFPYDVAAGDELTAWIDVFVPAGTPAGTYEGAVEVTSAAGTVATIPVSVAVFGVEMPSTSSLPSLFLMNPPGYQPCRAHTGEEWCSAGEDHAWDLSYLYARAALQNRMTIANPVPGAFQEAPTPARFKQYLEPLVNGSDSGQAGTVAPLMSGAQMTTVTAMWPCINNTRCLADWRNLAGQYGFGDRFYAYACDEPSVAASSAYDFDDWGDCTRNSRQARRTWPDVNTLVTSSAAGAQQAQSAGKVLLDQDVDVLVPNVISLAGNRPAYDSFLAGSGGSGNKQAWVYTSCSSYDCGEEEYPEAQDYPGYAIDQPASQARAIGWMAYLYGLQGELYWNTVNMLDTAWSNQYDFGANGDGNLFYPGSARGTSDAPAIGGRHDIPIESMRLKRIRDGREDYELLTALAGAGLGSQAMQVARATFGGQATAAHHTNLPAGEVDNARCSLVNMIDQTAATYCS